MSVKIANLPLGFFTKNGKIIELIARPDKTDYIHHIYLLNNQEVVLTDGGCQCVYGQAKGNFSISILTDDKIKFRFFNLKLLDPYDDNIIFADLAPFETLVHKQEIISRFTNYGTSEFSVRYEVDVDPLKVFRENCNKYSSKYIPDYEESDIAMIKDNSRYSENGIYFNELEKYFYLASDEKIL